MDITSVLKNEIFRPLTTLIVPGAFASAPYILLCKWHYKGVGDFASTNSAGFSVILFIIVLTAGLILEDIGGRIETSISNHLKKQNPKHQSIWRSYLKLNTQDQFIGQRYLRTIVTRFYFELAMAPATAFFLIGFHWLNILHPFITCIGATTVSAIAISLGIFLFCEARRSAYVLSTLREAIIEGYSEYNLQNKQ